MSKEQLIDLDSKQLDLIKKIICLHAPNRTVWAYGSRVTWKAGEASDLDLAVFNSNSMEVMDLKDALIESDLLISVDVMDWETIPENFKENIKRKYVVLQESSTPKGWREVKLGEVAKIKNGKRNSQDAVEHGEYPLFDRSQVIKRSDQHLFDTRAIIIAGEGKEFIPRYYEGKFDLHQRAYAVFNFANSVDSKYIYYSLLNNRGYFSSVAVGSTVLSLRLNHFQNFPILCPPLPEQKAIAEVLSSLDDKKTCSTAKTKPLKTWRRHCSGNGLSRKWRRGGRLGS